ncbi:MAG: SpoIIE family protein phosphatase [Actinomycetota bacterium]|nr:SpoIIE family protein phosphatase [Actinomycetota bacterium]
MPKRADLVQNPVRSFLPASPEDVSKGSWRWSLRVAQLIAWGTVAVVALVFAVAELPSEHAPRNVALLAALVAWTFVLFRWILPEGPNHKWIPVVGLVSMLVFASLTFGAFRFDVPSAQLVFVPVIAIMGLLTGIREGVAAAALALVAYVVTTLITGSAPNGPALAVNAGIFLLSGAVSGVLAAEMRTHYRGEREEHRLATAVRHRLLAVLDAVDEAIVFRDRQGIARVINQRAGDLFQIRPDDYLGSPVVELLRTIAKATEDPEGFMEMFQELRDEPDKELRSTIEQIIPERREFRLYSAPTFDESGALVGRIDVYTDVTEAMRRAQEIKDLYEKARETAESYQRSLLPDVVPRLPRTGLVAHYVPAAGRRAVCGDFYDFISLRDGRIGFVLGDVVGIGPTAANDAALTRYTLRSFVSEETELAPLMERLNLHLNDHMSSERFVRLLFAALDPERARLEYVSAGHVPPIVYRAKTREVEWLQEGGMALGVERDASYKTGRIDFEPGDMLVLYTDGVTEAPRLGRPFGQGKFSDLVTDYGGGTPGELVQAIRRSVENWSANDELRDDLALIVCQVTPDEAITQPARELVLPNEPARMAEIRSFVASFLTDVRCPVEVSQDVLLAVGEAAANACRHGRRRAGRSELRMRCARSGGRVAVTIADDGPGFDLASVERRDLPDRFASGGRGLFLMKTLMDEVEVDSSDDGTTVTLTRSLRRPPTA